MPLFPPRTTGGLGAQEEQPGGLGGFLGGALGGLSRFNDQRPELLMMAGQLLKGEDPWPAIAYGQSRRKTKREEAETKRKDGLTRSYLMRKGLSPEDADAVIASGQAGSYMKAPRDAGEITYSKTPIWGKDAEGNDVLGTIGDDGSFRAIDTNGFTPSRGLEKVDLGTAWGFRDKGTGEIVHTEPKDLRGAEREKGIGEAEGKSASSAPADYQAGQNALDLADQIMTNPALESGTGFSSKIWNWLPGSSEYDFQNLVDQAKSGAFLTAIQQMRGLGALSNAEGSAATQAITRMNTATSKEAFIKALMDYRAIVEQGMANAQARAGKAGVQMLPGAPTGGTSNRTSSGVEWSVEP
jgi:hypothetical protein